MKIFDSASFAQPSQFSSSEPEKNAIYYVPTNSFAYKQPAVPLHSFEKERKELLEDSVTTRIICLDLSSQMELTYPATTPNLLARYIVVAPGDDIGTQLNAVAEIYYVIRGAGESANRDDQVEWKEGDVFVFPGGLETRHQAREQGAILYVVTDEPMLSFCGTAAGSFEKVALEATHYPIEKIDESLNKVYMREEDTQEAAKSVFFTSAKMEKLRTTSPNITANLNTLEAGGDQRPHRHNAAALTLSIVGDKVFSLVDGERSDWQQFGVMVTPPTALHSHHNRSDKTMRSFVVQDSGLYYYSRTTGFRFDE